MPTDTPALLPPHPDRPGRYWIACGDVKKPEVWEFLGGAFGFWVDANGDQVLPEVAHDEGYTLAIPHPIPSAAALEAVYALARLPDGPSQPASAFAVGYTAGMGYLAKKLRAALETKETTWPPSAASARHRRG